MNRNKFESKRLIFGIVLFVLVVANAIIVFRDRNKTGAMAQSGLSCAAFHSGKNSPFENAKCMLPSGEILEAGQGDCIKGGRLTTKPATTTSSDKACVRPGSQQVVEQGQAYSYFLISAGTKEDCFSQRKSTVCDSVSGAFSPPLPEHVYDSCSVLKAEGSTLLRWSDPSTWNGKMPSKGSHVLIPDGRLIVLDVNPPPLSMLQVDGVLIFANQDIELSVNALFLRGSLQIGSPSAKYEKQALIRINKPDQKQKSKFGMFMLSGGQFDIHGLPLSPEEAQRLGAFYPWRAPRFANIKIEVENE